MMNHKILIVGAGSIGTRHLKNLLKLGYKNLAVCDPDGEKLKAVSELGNFALYKNSAVALKKERPEIVFICNPTHLHVPSANLALDFGAHVFIEKPLSHNLTGIDALIKKAKNKKKIVMVACNYRFHSGFQKLKKLLAGGKFGKPLLARVTLGYYLPAARKNANYKKVYAAGTKGGGVVLDSGSHAADYLRALFGAIKKSAVEKSAVHTIGIKSEEAAAVIFKHESGAVSELAIDYVRKTPVHRIEILAQKGILNLDFRANKQYLENMFITELKHFLECVRKKQKPAQSLEEAKEIVKVLTI